MHFACFEGIYVKEGPPPTRIHTKNGILLRGKAPPPPPPIETLYPKP